MQNIKAVKRRRPLKIALISILALIVILVGAVLIFLRSSGISLHSVNASQMRTMDFSNIEMYPPSFATDALQLVRTVESTHPIFVLGDYLPADYEAIRDEFLEIARSGDLTRQDFSFAILRYFSTLRDSHMSIGSAGRAGLQPFGGHLDISWQVQDGQLFLLDGSTTTGEVIEIGGVPVAHVFAVTDRYWYAENTYELQANRNNQSRLGDVIERAGGQINNGLVALTISDDGGISTINVQLDFDFDRFHVDFIIRHEMMEDVFFIDLRVFSHGEHIIEVVESIESAVANGTRKFIVDLRGNMGGAAWVGQDLLGAMGITIPEFGSVRRTTGLAATHEEVGLWHMPILDFLGVDYSRMTPTVGTSSNPNNVFVSVLTDVETYSSATWMAVWVQDGGFGNIIGSPSRNAPTSFGHVVPYHLSYSNIWLSISIDKWLRPDVNADQLVLRPDILVNPDEALEVALEYLHNLEN